MSESIDPAAVMAAHHEDDEGTCASCDPFSLVPWPCEPYRLAEALANGLPEWERAKLQDALSEARTTLAAEQARVERVEELRDDWRQRAASARDATDDDWAGDGWTDVADELDTALSDQPKQVQS